jgi:hypothetical protein
MAAMTDPVTQATPTPATSPTAPPTPSQPPWAALCTGTGLGLIIVATLTFLGIIAQGIAIEQDTSVWYRQGIGFLRNLDASPIGLMLIVGVALVGVPVVVADETRRAPRSRQTALALGLAAGIALMVAMGAVLGVITRLHFDTGPGQEITTVTRRVLATFVVRNLGPALVAFAAALGVARLGSHRAVTPPPYRGPGAADVEPGAGASPS